MLEIVLGQVPEAVYFTWFMILAKKLKEKRLLFTVIMICEYILCINIKMFNTWAHIIYTVLTFITLKVLYKEKSQITDIFTFGIASLVLIICSIISGGLYLLIPIIGIISSRVLPFMIIFVFRNKLYNIQKLYKYHWNRNDEVKTKIKSTTFRCLNVVIFNLMFHIINTGMIYAILTRK